MGESSARDPSFRRHQHLGSLYGYTEIGSRSNGWKEHTHTEGHKIIWLNFLLLILGLFAAYDPVWTSPMIYVTCYGISIKCPSNFRQPLWILLFISFFFCIRPKSKGKQKGRISPRWWSSPMHNLWGLLKISDVYRFVSFRLMCQNHNGLLNFANLLLQNK